MKAAQCRVHGGPEQVEVVDVESPALGDGQIRVAVEAAAVNFPDVLIVANSYQIKAPAPFVVGSEFAGVVAEVAGDVDVRAVGDRVFGSSLVGAFAEEIVVNAGSVATVPDGVGLDVAAGFGVAHRTAYHVLRSVAAIQPGEELVVLGAGGGVGLAAVQLGALMGANVTAVASSAAKLTAARSCGATRGINYRERDLRQVLREEVPGGVDVVVDPVGGDLSEPALRAMRRDGRFVTVGYAAGSIPRIPLNLVLLKGMVVMGFEILGWSTSHPKEVERNEAELMALLASGKATPYVESRYPLDQVVEALKHVANGRAIGKVLLEITPR